MSKADVSIIVAIYKVESYLPKCIESLLSQSYNNIEIILVDDGSPDNCPNICDNYAKMDNRIKVIHKKNEGVVRARHTGIENATCKYVVLIDGDDWLDSGYIEKLYNTMTDNNADMVTCSFMSNQNGISKLWEPNIDYGVYDGSRLNEIKAQYLSFGEFFKFGVAPTLWSKILKKDLLLDIYKSVPSNITMGEDLIVSLPYFDRCKRVCIADLGQYYRYEIRENSMSKGYDKNIVNKVIALIKQLRALNLSSVFKDQLSMYYLYLLIGLIAKPIKADRGYAECCSHIEDWYNFDFTKDEIRCLQKQKLGFSRKLFLWAFINKNNFLIYTMFKINAILVKIR